MFNRKNAIAAAIVGLSVMAMPISVLAAKNVEVVNLSKENGVYAWKISGNFLGGCNLPVIKPELPEENSFATQVIKLVNEERAKEGLPALQYDASVAKAALVRAKETEILFSHTRPNGTSFSTALKENGVSYRGAGENIAWGQKSPEEVMRGWMQSPGHRANIMDKNFTKIGVGYYQNSRGVNYWTQLFTY